MNGDRFHVGALISGLLFTILGTLFLLDQLDVVRIRASYVWPIVLIVLGGALLLGGRRSSGT